MSDEAPAGPPTKRRITLRDGSGRDVELVRPRSFAERYDVAAAAGENVHRACAAALGFSWVWLRRQLGPYDGRSACAYGGRVIDFLTDQGVPFEAVIEHGLAAMKLCTEGLVDGKEVATRADFS